MGTHTRTSPLKKEMVQGEFIEHGKILTLMVTMVIYWGVSLKVQVVVKSNSVLPGAL